MKRLLRNLINKFYRIDGLSIGNGSTDLEYLKALLVYFLDSGHMFVGCLFIVIISPLFFLFWVLLLIIAILYSIAMIKSPFIYIKERKELKLRLENLRKRKEKLEDELKNHEQFVLACNEGEKMRFSTEVDINAECHNYKEFLDAFFNVYNKIYDTYSSSERYRFICSKDKRRSLGDIWLITSNYFPKVTMKEVLYYLMRHKLLSASKCNQIGKYVFYKNNGTKNYSQTLEFSSFNTDEIIELVASDF